MDGRGNVCDSGGSGAVRGGDRDTFEFDIAYGAISKRDRSRDTGARAAGEEGEKGLKREDKGGLQLPPDLLDGPLHS